MLRQILRCGLALATLIIMPFDESSAQTIAPIDVHREAVDVSQYPWSAIGKLYNETGGACTAVIVDRDKVLTAAHCVYNFRTRQFIRAEFLHFLVGYRSGLYSTHARVASYEVGSGFDPLRYSQTSDADWAMLTLTESLPAEIEPLRLAQAPVADGTRAVIAGYPQDRAFAMTADEDCQLIRAIDDGKLMLHTCRGVRGYSGAPILVAAADNKIEVAGIHIAVMQDDGAQKMLAVPARTVELALKVDVPPAADPLYTRNNIAGYASGFGAFA
jgi:protease YdgD